MKDFEVGEKVELPGTAGGRRVSGEVIRLDSYGRSFLVKTSHGGSLWFDQPSVRVACHDCFHDPNLLRRVDSPQESTGEEQPAPTPNDGTPIWELVIADMT